MLVEGPAPLFKGDHFENEFPVDDPGLAMLAVLVGAINIAVLLLMLYVYLKSYLKFKYKIYFRTYNFCNTTYSSKYNIYNIFVYKRRIQRTWYGSTCFNY